MPTVKKGFLGLLVVAGMFMLPFQLDAASIGVEDLVLTFDAAGQLNRLDLGGELHFLDPTNTGLYVTDVHTGQSALVQGPLRREGETWIQECRVDLLGLQVTLKYIPVGDHLRVVGKLQDLLGRDRALVVEYRLGLEAVGWTWGDDLYNQREIRPGQVYHNTATIAPHLKMNVYPFSALSGKEVGLALAVPMDCPRVYHISYAHQGGAGQYTIQFALGLTEATAKFPSLADFEFILYAYPGEWGFRQAAHRYYRIYPQFFARRVEEGGNWLFQQDYRSIPGVADFGFRFNETPLDYRRDQAEGIISFQYTAPAEKWIGWPERPRDPEPTYEEFVQLLERALEADPSVLDFDHRIVPLREVAEAVINSAIYRKDGTYYTVGWYAYGPMVNFVVNGSPHVLGRNFFDLQVQEVQWGTAQAERAGATLGGIYVDNLNWQTPIMNYRKDHFAVAQYPLIWDEQGQLCQPLAFTQYEYLEGMATIAREEGKVILANFAFPRFGLVHYAHLVDVLGGEIGKGWGSDEADFAARRTLAYQKPWVLLYTQYPPGGQEVRLTFHELEQLTKQAMFYGVYVNSLGLGASTLEDFEHCRALFQKYVPIVQALDGAGWEPVTWAKGTSPQVAVERFGDAGAGYCYFTVRGESTAELVIDLVSLGFRVEDFVAYDLVHGAPVPTKYLPETGQMELKLIVQDGVTAILCGNETQVLGQLAAQVAANVTRAQRAVESALAYLRGSEPVLQEQWTELLAAIESCFERQESTVAAGIAGLLDLLDRLLSFVWDLESRVVQPLVKNVVSYDAVGPLERSRSFLQGLVTVEPAFSVTIPDQVVNLDVHQARQVVPMEIVHNAPYPVEVRYSLAYPAGWDLDPLEGTVVVPGGAKWIEPLELVLPESVDIGFYMLNLKVEVQFVTGTREVELSRQANVTEQVLFVDFEAGVPPVLSPTPYFDSPIFQWVADSPEVVSGRGSLWADSTSTILEWNEVFWTDVELLPLVASGVYLFSFDYRIIESAEHSFYFFARTPTGGVPQDRTGIIFNGPAGEMGHKEGMLILGRYDDYFLSLGIHGRGRIVIDNFEVRRVK